MYPITTAKTAILLSLMEFWFVLCRLPCQTCLKIRGLCVADVNSSSKIHSSSPGAQSWTLISQPPLQLGVAISLGSNQWDVRGSDVKNPFQGQSFGKVGVLPSVSPLPLCYLEADDHESLKEAEATRLNEPSRERRDAHSALLSEQEICPCGVKQLK